MDTMRRGRTVGATETLASVFVGVFFNRREKSQRTEAQLAWGTLFSYPLQRLYRSNSYIWSGGDEERRQASTHTTDFDDLFDGASGAPKTRKPVHHAPRLTLEDLGDVDDAELEELKNEVPVEVRGKKRDRPTSDVETSATTKRARVEPKSAARSKTVLALDSDDEDDIQIKTAGKSTETRSKSRSTSRQEDVEVLSGFLVDDDAELRALLKDVDDVPQATKSSSTDTNAVQSLAALHSATARAAAMKQRLKEFSREINEDDVIVANSASVSPAGNVRLTVVDAASQRRATLSALSAWTGAQLLSMAQRLLGLASPHVLRYLGIPVDPARTLAHYRIADGDELTLVPERPARADESDLDADIQRRVLQRSSTSVGAVAAPVEEAENNGGIRLKIKVNKQEIVVALKRDDPFSKVFAALRSRLGVPESGKLRLELDGEAIMAEDSPADLDLEDGDQLDAFVKLAEEPQAGPATRSKR